MLPFTNLSGDPEQEYFADGMVEDIIAGLSRIKWLFVIARYSSFTYKGVAIDVKQVGRELGVRYLMQGSVRKDGRRVRISAQMVEAESGHQLWSERFDRPLDDVFALQDEIALNVVSAIEPSLRRAEVERVKRKRPDSLDAYDLVLQAQPDVDSGMPAQVTKALVLLGRALALDPTYALAHANAAMCHHCLFLRSGLREEERSASVRHAQAAIAHGRDDPRALTLAGFSIGMDGHDRAAAFVALEAALAISPSSALTYILGGVILAWGGEAERAIEWSERGMRLSPLDPWAFAAFDAQAMGHFHLGRYDKAAHAAYKSIHANPALASPTCSWLRRSPSLAGWKKPRQLRQRSWNCIPLFGTAANSPASIARPHLPLPWVKRLERSGCRSNFGTCCRFSPFVAPLCRRKSDCDVAVRQEGGHQFLPTRRGILTHSGSRGTYPVMA